MSYAVTSCYPEFQDRMHRGYNLTGIFEFFRSERTMSTLCGYASTFRTVDTVQSAAVCRGGVARHGDIFTPSCGVSIRVIQWSGRRAVLRYDTIRYEMLF